MKPKNEIIVIQLTHWDREWRFPFEKTRLLLVEMMDHLLTTMENNPAYKYFHLDGQTILLDDYCEVRPENKDRIIRLVKAGRLLIGPWYCLPDVNQLMGESIIRNFLWGEKTGRKYGGNMNVGYSPASWGQISQMPQIMNGFGIKSIIFYRGISADQVPGHYYIWEGPDGSELFGVRLGDLARSAFFHLVDRPVVHNRGRGDQTHEWSRGGKPFRICERGSTSVYEFVQPPMGWYPHRLEEAIRELDERELGKWETPFTPGIECNDCTGIFPDTPRIVEEANRLIENDKKMSLGSFPLFVERAMNYLDKNSLIRIKGEMRYPQRAGVWTDLYAGIQATRMPLKYAHRQTEFLLQRVTEPLCTMAWLAGMRYPRWHLDKCWHLLLASQTHDSIGGCGVDAVAEDVMERFRQIKIICHALTDLACKQIIGRIDASNMQPEDILIVVFNTLPCKRDAVVTAEVDTEITKKIRGFNVYTLDNKELTVQMLSREEVLATFNHPHELPLRTRCHRWSFKFFAPDIPPMGYKTFKFVPAPGEMRHPGTQRPQPNAMENEYLRVEINPDGTFNLLHKETGRWYRQLGYYEDYGDAGDHWVIIKPPNNPHFYSRGLPAEISVIEDGPLSTIFCIKQTMNIPEGVTPDRTARSSKCLPLHITTYLQLVRGERFLRIKVTVENKSECHVLRIMFPTHIRTDVVHVEMPLDVVTRQIKIPPCRDWREPYEGVQVQQNMLSLSDGKNGFAVLNKGLTQYEVIDNEERTIAVTLLRAITNWNSVRLAYYPDQTGTQLFGTHSFELAVMPHKGDWKEGECLTTAQLYNVNPLVVVAGPGEGDLPMEMSFLQISDPHLILTALKQYEWEENSSGNGKNLTLIARLHNPANSTVKTDITSSLPVISAELVDMKETSIIESLPVQNGKKFSLQIPPHKVVTIKISVKNNKQNEVNT